MLNSYTNTTQTVAQNSPVDFNINRVLRGCGVSHAEGTPTIRLSKCGYYLIIVDATITNATGTISYELQNNSTTVDGATAATTVAATSDIISQSISALIRIPPSCCAIDNTASLTVVNTGSAADYTNVSIVITKLD